MNLLQNYPFKCDDCNYATKYTHSLKLHLQKYSHNRRVEVNENEAVAPIAAL